MRNITDFNADWRFSKAAILPDALPLDWPLVSLPHTWNAQDGQDGGNDYWRGTALYVKSFPQPPLENPTDRVFLEFLGAAITADVSLNGLRLAHHEGGYSTFRVDITDALQPENLLCVAVDNYENDRVYPQKADFTFYGGLYRSVNLITVPAQHFELTRDGTPGIKVTPTLSPDRRTAAVTIETWQNTADPVEISIPEAGLTQTVSSQNGHACATFHLDPVHLWDGQADPFLYTAAAQLPSGDCIAARFGCRQIAFDASLGFLLNGRPYPLRGVSRHQDRQGLGSALTLREHQEDMAILREIGANTVRLAHYQHAQEFYDLCDQYGILAWAEIPYITQHMPQGRQNTLDQMRELITQCYNHPSILCWGLSNEITASGEATEDLMENHRLLNNLCHQMDPTRPTTMAHVFMLETDSPLIDIPDIGSYNLYFGWYLGSLTQNDDFFDAFHTKFPRRILGFSEYGADANPQFHSSAPERGDYTEEYQCFYHEHLLRVIEQRPYLWATHVWNLFDFAADGRDEGGKKGINQKGLVSFDRTLKKDAFYLYKAAWSKEPFVHLCGRRYADRAEDTTHVKVYSNQPAVTLLVDGKELATLSGRTVFTFTVPLSAEHRIEAVSGSCRDQMTLRRTPEPNPSYLFRKTEVVNWFDKDTFRPDCYSIQDTMGTLMQNPRTAAILGKMMERMTASRGDVAKSASGNANLQRMMAGLSLESLIKQAGDAVPPEMVKSLNAALQQIPK